MDYTPWQIPENPFDYTGLVDRSDGIGTLPGERQGTPVAIIGAGCSGLCAAYELMKVGLKPVLFESARNPDGTPRIGGRTYTYRFPGDPKALAELGAMRIPPVHRTLAYYLDRFKIDYSLPFPDPLIVPTTLYFEGRKHFIPVGAPLPGPIQRAAQAWKMLIDPLIASLARVWDKPDLRRKKWQRYVAQYADKSFFQVLSEHGLSRSEIKLFGSLGIGTGGFDSIYPVSFIEVLRITVCQWEADQRLIKGGTQLIAEAFWNRERRCTHWDLLSVRGLNAGHLQGAVTALHTPADPRQKVTLIDESGITRRFDAVIITCAHRALEMGLQINRRTFSDEVWEAIQNVHMLRSGKVFIRTKTAFWKDMPPAETLTTTITDEAIRGTYLFDFEDTPSGVICLSYTWEDSSTKFNALTESQQVELSIRTLAKIYGRDLISPQLAESVSFFWEDAPGYFGAFKLNYPGQYEQQTALFRQPLTPGSERHNGVFLAGESTSWAGGWIEGALHSGLDAAQAVIRRLGGAIHGSN